MARRYRRKSDRYVGPIIVGAALAGLVAFINAVDSGNWTAIGVLVIVAVTIPTAAAWVIVRRIGRWRQRRATMASYLAMQRSAHLAQIDQMSGRQFEDFLALLFQDLGYHVDATKVVGDYGGDLVLSCGPLRIVVQAKRYSSRPGVAAIQEANTARSIYNAPIAAVVTNSEFTAAAVRLARSADVHLVDRTGLHQLIQARSGQASVPVGLLPGLPASLAGPLHGPASP